VRATARRPIAELGVLGAIAAEESVTDIFVNGDGTVWCDRGAGNELVDRQPLSPAAARELAVRLIALGGRHLDESKPNF
jgi:pilus assembly protein CpaF